MEIIVRQNKKGFTLIEALIAIAILTISMLAVLEVVIISFQSGLRNSIRNEAIMIAEIKMNELRNAPPSAGSASSETRNFRNLTVTYRLKWTVDPLSANSAALDVSVSWDFKGREYTHSTVSIVSHDV